MITPTVVTSRVARENFDNIRAQHGDILTGIANQSLKVDAFNQQRAAEMANTQAMQGEIEKAKISSDTQANQDSMDFSMRQSELDVKRAALASD